MKSESRFQNVVAFMIMLIGAGLVLYGFFQPWVEARLVVKKMIYSGYQLTSDSVAMWTVPILAVFSIFFTFQFMLRQQLKYRIMTLVLGLLGAIFMILVFSQIDKQLWDWVEKAVGFKFRVGIMIVLSGFLLQVIGASIGKFRKNPMAPKTVESAPEN